MQRIWREVFLDVSLRAIRRVHQDFGIWELGQTNLTLREFSDLNQGNGISFAPEETVRDAISQEIILLGLWKKHPVEGEKRSWWIDREVRIPFKASEAKLSEFHKPLFKTKELKEESEKYFDIDIIFKRIELKAKDGAWTLPTLIEAKRFERLTIDLKTKKLKIGRPQISDIDKDICKLKLLQDVYKDKKFTIKENTYKGFRTCILIWGVSDRYFDVKEKLIKKLKNGKYLSENEMSVRYLPIQWSKKLLVTKSLWLCLIEIE